VRIDIAQKRLLDQLIEEMLSPASVALLECGIREHSSKACGAPRPAPKPPAAQVAKNRQRNGKVVGPLGVTSGNSAPFGRRRRLLRVTKRPSAGCIQYTVADRPIPGSRNEVSIIRKGDVQSSSRVAQ
jgi:hypothetical protein